MRALVNDEVSTGRDGQVHEESSMESQTEKEESSVLVARTALAVGNVGEGIYRMLLAFHIFKPSLQWRKSSEADTDMKSKLWYIIFLVRGAAILSAGILTDHPSRSLHSAVSAFDLIPSRAPSTSTLSISCSKHYP